MVQIYIFTAGAAVLGLSHERKALISIVKGLEPSFLPFRTVAGSCGQHIGKKYGLCCICDKIEENRMSYRKKRC